MGGARGGFHTVGVPDGEFWFDHIYVGISLGDSKHSGKCSWQHYVVGIMEVQPFAFRSPDAGYAGRRRASIGLRYDFHPAVVSVFFVEKVERIVCASVVYGDDFKIGSFLREHRPQRLRQSFGGIVDGYYDVYLWHRKWILVQL